MNKDMKVANIVRQIEVEKAKLTKVRNKLRHLHDDLGAILESSEDGLRELQSACDALSRFV